MVLPKENHTKSYHKRFRVKYKRRRQCKTNYAKRIRLASQYKNKYYAKKYRFVVRKTNRDIVCQIFSNDMTHDVCLASAYSHELKRYGVVAGFTNYPAAYCTGLLLARRVISLLKIDTEAISEVTGEFHLEEEEGAFRAFLDTGLARCTTGANIFGALKGAVDGGLNIPHSTRRFAGNIRELNEEGKPDFEFDPELHRERIVGEHIVKYMRTLSNEDEDLYKKQFSHYIDKKIGPDDVTAMYLKAHELIKKNPSTQRSELERGYFCIDRKKPVNRTPGFERPHMALKSRKLTGAEKKQRVIAKLAQKKSSEESQA